MASSDQADLRAHSVSVLQGRPASSHCLAAARWGAPQTAREPRSGARAWFPPAVLLRSPRRQEAIAFREGARSIARPWDS